MPSRFGYSISRREGLQHVFAKNEKTRSDVWPLAFGLWRAKEDTNWSCPSMDRHIERRSWSADQPSLTPAPAINRHSIRPSHSHDAKASKKVIRDPISHQNSASETQRQEEDEEKEQEEGPRTYHVNATQSLKSVGPPTF